MPVTYLELENFKSYAGIQRIGPFRDFTSVIGPNGSGKSNLMDAISFILGVNSRNLRSSQLKDLIFRPPDSLTDPDQGDDGDDNDNDIDSENESEEEESGRRKRGGKKKGPSASASLIYVNHESESSDPTETRFSRTISAKGVGEYKINHKTVTFAQYEKELASIGVLLKGRNFLVFQGDVESTARKSPKELTVWFEEISNSMELKEGYEEAYQEMKEKENHARSTSQKQKGFWKKKRELKAQKEEAEKFRLLVDSKAKLLTEFFLWQLFHIKTDIDEKEEFLDEVNQEIKDANNVVAEKTNVLRQAKKEASKIRTAANKLEKQRVALAAEVDQTQPSAIQSQEEIKNLKKKLSNEQNKHKSLQKEKESRAQTLETLENEIKEYTETETQLKNEYDEAKQSKSDTKLTEEQEAEYEEIREAAAVASVKPRQALDIARSKLDSVRVKIATLIEDTKDLKLRKNDALNRLKELEERKRKLETVSATFYD